ncbi:MAG: hypothetical protein COB20_10680 [SAR86 cluster bacterium]|uniref:Uncharacterized protein n=1 Tax=SAR86 cluster bacterium TaxID=2030880 RepID=A0A2A4X2V2_9GAMM|nr:MAG: hypothetical protein COB20_10680 [SAR86 cluster bacterium]
MANSQQQKKHTPRSPDSAKLEKTLRSIARARTRLAVCFWTLPVYVVAIWLLLNNGRSIDSMMWIYMAVYAGFAIDMSMRNCPNCHKQFYVKSIFLNLLTKQCVHCGQTSTPVESISKD